MLRNRMVRGFILILLLAAWTGPVGATADAASSAFLNRGAGGPGDLDWTFGSMGVAQTTFGGSTALVVQPDRKIVVAGRVFGDFGLLRYNYDGSLDTSFGSGGKVTTDIAGNDDSVAAMALQPDGKIIVVGNDSYQDPVTSTQTGDIELARYNGNGSLDMTFNGNGKVVTDFGNWEGATGVAVQPDGKILVVGGSYDGSVNLLVLARYNTDGSLDTSFDGDGKVSADLGGIPADGTAIAVQADGKILVSGGANYTSFALIRFNADGSLDTSFGSSGLVTTTFGYSAHSDGMAIQTDGKIILVGLRQRDSLLNITDFAMARYNPDGSLDTTFGNAGKVTSDFGGDDEGGRVVAVQPDGKIVVAGYVFMFDRDIAVVRYNPDGSRDLTFTGEQQCCSEPGMVTNFLPGDDDPSGIALQPDGRIVIVDNNYSDSFTVVRYNGVITAAVLLQPADEAQLATSRPTFVWEAVPGATKYTLQVSKNYKFTDLLVNKDLTGTSFTMPTNLPNGATVFWQVRFHTATGPGRLSPTRYFMTPNPPSVPTLVSPADGAGISDYTPRLDWSNSQLPDLTYFAEYQLQLVRGKNFTGAAIIHVPGPLTNSKYIPTTNLAANTDYSWRVRAVNTFGNSSDWSKTRSFHTLVVDPVTDLLWTPAGVMNDAGRYNHTATLLPNGNVLVIGGLSGSTYAGMTKLYHPATRTWTDAGALVDNRQLHTATLLNNGKVLVAGGENGSGFLGTAVLYDPTTGSWTATGSLNVARSGHTATLLPDGKVLVAGGVSSTGILDSSELYDPGTETWTLTGSVLNASRYGHTAVLLPNGKVLVTGGDSSSEYLASAELYDPVADSWTMMAPMTTARFHNTTTLLPSGLVLVAGGNGFDGVLESAELYNPNTNVWTPTGMMNQARSGHTATLLPDGEVLVAAGVDRDHFASSNAELYNPATGKWRFTSSLNDARSSQTATLLPNGQVLAAGGIARNVALSSAELYAPAAILMAPADGAQLLNNRPLFDWTDVPGAVRYALQIDNSASFGTPLVSVVTAPSRAVLTVDLPAGASLYWRVRYDTAAGPGLWSLASHFTTARPPAVPALVSPTANALVTDYTPRLDWSNSSIPAGTTFQKYELQLSANNPGFTGATSVDVSGTASNSQYTVPADLLPNTRYYWRVRAFNTGGQYSNWSVVRVFRTAIQAPVLSSPVNGGSTSDRTPRFTWTGRAGATGYVVQVSTTNSFASTLLNVSVSGTSYTPPAGLPLGTFYWRVRALGPNGPGIWSSVFRLTIH